MTREAEPAGPRGGDADAPGARTLVEPDLEVALAHVAGGLDRGALVTLFGRCTVDYEGRAASELGPGDRHLMLKPDGTALVHTAGGQQPVNWQPPGCEHDCRLEDGADGDGRNGEGGDGADGDGDGQDGKGRDSDAELVVESRRTAPEESLVVRFASIAHVAAFPVDGDGAASPAVVGTEADLKQRVLADPALVEPGFSPLATERETPAGAVDVYGEDREGRTVVLELKRRRVGPDAVGQLDRYVRALERDLHAQAEVRGVLVAPSLTERGEKLLAEKGLEFVSLTPLGE